MYRISLRSDVQGAFKQSGMRLYLLFLYVLNFVSENLKFYVQLITRGILVLDPIRSSLVTSQTLTPSEFDDTAVLSVIPLQEYDGVIGQLILDRFVFHTVPMREKMCTNSFRITCHQTSSRRFDTVLSKEECSSFLILGLLIRIERRVPQDETRYLCSSARVKFSSSLSLHSGVDFRVIFEWLIRVIFLSVLTDT